MSRTRTIALAFGLLAALALVATAGAAHQSGPAGHVYVLSNAPAGNAVLDYARASDGTLSGPNSYPTGGTGTGGGVVVHGHVCTGPNAIAGEWGHNPLPWPDDEERPGPPCYCGKHGCIETFLSGPGMARDHERATGTRLEAPEIAARASAGDAACDATLARYERRMAKALATIINVMLSDDRRSWQLQPDATWVRTETLEGREGSIDTFEVLKEDAVVFGSVVTTPRRPGAGAGSLDPRA